MTTFKLPKLVLTRIYSHLLVSVYYVWPSEQWVPLPHVLPKYTKVDLVALWQGESIADTGHTSVILCKYEYDSGYSRGQLLPIAMYS